MDERLGIDGAFSEGVKRIGLRLAVLMPYAKASQIADELAWIKLSAASIWKITQEAGQAPQSAWDPVTSQKQSSSERMGLALDGCMMNIREEGWKEAKLGVIFEIEDAPKPNPEDIANQVVCTQQSHVIELGGPEALSNQLAAEARARHFSQAPHQAVIGDGAEWIWNIARSDYPNAAQINDWYHACQHLHSAATLLFPDAKQGGELVAWFEHHKHVLFGGGADMIANEIRTFSQAMRAADRALLETKAAYFETRFELMQYADFRDAGLPIGSGVVEAAAKQVKQRMSGPGMRWSRQGARNLLPFLAAELSGTFDPFWAQFRPKA